MKKVLVLCLMLALVVGMSMNVFAVSDGFVSSPSVNPAPTVVSFTPSNEQCTATITITAYADKSELPDELLALFEKAYSDIADCDDLTKLNSALAKIASDKGINGADLAVSDLFDIHVVGCDYHDGHVDFEVTLDVEALSRFVGLLHMNKDGEWELVEDAEVVKDGDHLKFSVDSFSPFAVVVDTSVKDATPQTGDSNMIYVYVAVMAVSALAVLLIVIKRNKQKA